MIMDSSTFPSSRASLPSFADRYGVMLCQTKTGLPCTPTKGDVGALDGYHHPMRIIAQDTTQIYERSSAVTY